MKKFILGMLLTVAISYANNIRPTFKGASFDESKFELYSDKDIVINLGY